MVRSRKLAGPPATVFVMAALTGLPGCGSRQVSDRLVIRGGPSLDALFADLVRSYQQEHPALRVVSSFSCPPCILYGRGKSRPRFDVFVSLGKFEMQLVQARGGVRFRNLTNIGSTSLSLVVPKHNVGLIRSLSDLHTPTVKRIGVGDPENAAVGYYAKKALSRSGLWDELEDRFVFKRSGCEIVKLIGLGRDLDAAMVFSVCLGENGGKAKEVLRFPRRLVPPVPLLMGVTTDARNRAEACRFVRFVSSPKAAPLLKRHHVIPVEGDD